MPGPPPTPSALNALRGWPGKRGKKPAEPKPAAATLEPPVELTAPARAIWDRHVPELLRLHLLTLLDTTTFATACRLQALGDLYAGDAERVTTRPIPRRGGRRVPHATSTAIKCWEKAAAIFARFGMTPSDRTRVQAPEPDAPVHLVPDGHRNPLEALRARRHEPDRPA